MQTTLRDGASFRRHVLSHFTVTVPVYWPWDAPEKIKRGDHFGVLSGLWGFQKITLHRETNSAKSQAKIRLAFHFVERNKYFTSLVFSVRTVSYGSSCFPRQFMARALLAWDINRREKNSVRNLRYGTRPRLVRGIHWYICVTRIYKSNRTIKSANILRIRPSLAIKDLRSLFILS